MAQINKIRLPNGRVVRPTEWSSTPLYSSVEIASGAITPLQAFSYGVGGSVPGSVGPRNASLGDTNMQGSGAILPENEELLLYTMGVEFFQNAADRADFFNGAEVGTPDPPEVSARNLVRVQRDTLLELRIADTKAYMNHPVGFFPAAMGICPTSGAATNEDGAAIFGAQNGGPNAYDMRKLATPHQIKPGEALSVTLKFPSGQVTGLAFGADTDARIRARIYLGGYRRRPVA